MTISHSPGNLIGMGLWVGGTGLALALGAVEEGVAPRLGLLGQVPPGPSNAVSASIAMAAIGLVTQIVNAIVADRKSKRDSDAERLGMRASLDQIQIKQAFGEAERDRIKADLDLANAKAAKVAEELERTKKEALLAASRIADQQIAAIRKKHDDFDKLNATLMQIHLVCQELSRANDVNAPALKAALDQLQIQMPTVTNLEVPQFRPIPQNPDPPEAP